MDWSMNTKENTMTVKEFAERQLSLYESIYGDRLRAIHNLMQHIKKSRKDAARSNNEDEQGQREGHSKGVV